MSGGPRQFSFGNAQEPAPNAVKSEFGGGEEHPDEDDESVPVVAFRAPKPAKKTPAITPKDVVKLAKARLRDVKKEIRKLKQLEKERAELERLIEAAEGRQVRSVGGAVVGTIKRSTG